MVSGDAYIDILDVDLGVFLGNGFGAENALHRVVDVAYLAELHAGRDADAVAGDVDLTILVAIADDGGDFGGADVQADYQVVVVVGILHRVSFYLCCAMILFLKRASK